MLKDILKLDGAQEVSKESQETIRGGGAYVKWFFPGTRPQTSTCRGIAAEQARAKEKGCIVDLESYAYHQFGMFSFVCGLSC
ncbi:hypothetical protein ACWGOQ_0020055 [Aquimarina sp. M1]